jgi:hypothetical protein
MAVTRVANAGCAGHVGEAYDPWRRGTAVGKEESREGGKKDGEVEEEWVIEGWGEEVLQKQGLSYIMGRRDLHSEKEEEESTK